MSILLGFTPFVVFAILTLVSQSLGIWLAFAAAFAITIRDFVEAPSLRLLDTASVLIFGALALFTGFVDPAFALQAVRMLVEAAFLLLGIGSILLRRPLTLAYGHDQVPEALWDTPAFRRANYGITLAWSLAFLVMGLSDAAVIVFPEVAPVVGFAVGLAALALAIAATIRYPARLSAKHPDGFDRA